MELILWEINYYLREGLWRTVQLLCNEELRRGTEPILIFWRAFSIFKEGGVTEAIRELNSIENRREVNFAVTVALIHYHLQCKLVDQEAVDLLSFSLEERQKSASDSALLVAAQFQMLIQEYRKANEIINQLLELNRSNLNARSTDIEQFLPKALDQFEQVTNEQHGGNPKHLDGLLGKSRALVKQKQFQDALEALNNAIIAKNWFVPALIEKAKVLMMTGDWDQSLEIAQKILNKQPFQIYALLIWIFHLLAREANIETAKEKLQELSESFQKQEPRNSRLIYQVVQPLVRVAGRRESILRPLLILLEKARTLDKDDSLLHTEAGYINLLLGDLNTAHNAYQQAATLDETAVQPLYGLVAVRIAQGQLKDASEQLEFLNELELSTGKSSMLSFLGAQLAARKEKDRDLAKRKLDEALKLHVADSKHLAPGLEFYTKLNPDFLLEISKEYLQYFGLEQFPKDQKLPHELERGIKLLESLTKQIPGLMEAQLLLAKAKHIASDSQGAQNCLELCMSLDPSYTEPYLLNALIHSSSGNLKAASINLDQAVAQDFQIRENPLYMLLKGQCILLEEKNAEQALPLLQSAFNSKDLKKGKILAFSQEEKAQTYICLCKCLAELNRIQEAQKLMSEAIAEFTSTSQEVKVLIANSELALKSGDIKKAVNILKTVQQDSQHFKKTRIALAEVYNKHLQNRRLYAKCYYDIVNADPSVENWVLLGEALMNIQEPEDAISAYEAALKIKKADPKLAKKVGEAHVNTHDYNRAIKYYTTALLSTQPLNELRTDLSKLYLKLGKYEDSAQVLTEALSQKITNFEQLLQSIENYYLLAKVYRKMQKIDDPLCSKPMEQIKQALSHARDLQKDVIQQIKDPGSLVKERQFCSHLYYKIGKYCEVQERNLQAAIQCHLESLNYNELNEKSLSSLTQLYLQTGDNDQCAKMCQQLLRVNPNYDQAAFRLADLAMLNNQTSQAMKIYKEVLNRQPGNYNALSKMINLMRRTGNVKEVKQVLDDVEKIRGQLGESGLAFCKGIYERMIGRPQEALSQFNLARNNSTYAEEAIKYMIEIYLNPDTDSIINIESATYNSQAIDAASELLSELAGKKGWNLMIAVYECYILMATKQKPSIEKAHSKLNEISLSHSNYIPAQVALSVCKILLDKKNDAKKILQNLATKPYQPEHAESFERS